VLGHQGLLGPVPPLNCFFRLLPSIDRLCVNVNLCDGPDCAETFIANSIDMHSRTESSQSDTSLESSATLTSMSLKVECADHFRYIDNQLLRWILRQIKCPRLQSFSSNIKVLRYGDGSERDKCLASIKEALDECHWPVLTEVRLQIGLGTTSQDSKIDTCVSRYLDRTSQTSILIRNLTLAHFGRYLTLVAESKDDRGPGDSLHRIRTAN
jgi:hypothetical protein